MLPSNQPDLPDCPGGFRFRPCLPLACLPQSVCQRERRCPISMKRAAVFVQVDCDVAGLPISLACGLDSVHTEFRTSILVALLTRYAYVANHPEEEDVRVARDVDSCTVSPTSYEKKD